MSLSFELSPSAALDIACDALIVGVYEDGSLSPTATAADAATDGALRRLVASGDVSGKAGSTAVLHALPGLRAARLVTVGLGAAGEVDPGRYIKAAAASVKALKGGPAQRVATALPEVPVAGRDAAWALRQAFVQGSQQTYRYTATRSGTAKATGPAVLVAQGHDSAVLAQAEAIAAGIAQSRALGDLPPNICNPAYIAAECQRLAADIPGASCDVLDEQQMADLGMGALLAVGRGSANRPRLVILRWNGAGDARPYVLVGKGITFDTGGINLKVQGGIEEMKYDMCGAASVIGAFVAAARMRLPINLVSIAVAVENMPDADAYRPSDVLTSMSGQTIEVLNTDAEGRLILCDALTYAQRFQPAALVDVATLTGACVIALGKVAHGLMSHHDDLADELLAAGQTAHDRAWRLPIWDDYQSLLDTDFADMANIGGKWAGAITAGCFLARFAKGQRWAHLDIAGPSYDEGRKGGATGRPVALLSQWLMDRARA